MQPSTETVWCVVRQLNNFFLGTEHCHGENRPKDLEPVFNVRTAWEGGSMRRATYLILDLSHNKRSPSADIELIRSLTHNFHVLVNIDKDFPG
jgi:hypothetical protein